MRDQKFKELNTFNQYVFYVAQGTHIGSRKQFFTELTDFIALYANEIEEDNTLSSLSEIELDVKMLCELKKLIRKWSGLKIAEEAYNVIEKLLPETATIIYDRLYTMIDRSETYVEIIESIDSFEWSIEDKETCYKKIHSIIDDLNYYYDLNLTEKEIQDLRHPFNIVFDHLYSTD